MDNIDFKKKQPSKHFEDIVTGDHTNTIESSWHVAKWTLFVPLAQSNRHEELIGSPYDSENKDPTKKKEYEPDDISGFGFKTERKKTEKIELKIATTLQKHSF